MMVVGAGLGDAPFTNATRARLVMAAEAAELADFARAFVPIYEGELYPGGGARSDGSWVDDAARLLAQAQRVFTATVVAERLGGASWQRIGDVLEMSRQSAHERYAEAEAQFRAELLSPENPDLTGEIGQIRYRLHPAARDPETSARELDEWLADRRSPHSASATDTDPDPHPVSRGLARMDPHAELLDLGGRRGALLREHLVPPAEPMLAIAERELALWRRLATTSTGRGRTDATRTADLIERQIAEYRAQIQARAERAAPGPDSR